MDHHKQIKDNTKEFIIIHLIINIYYIYSYYILLNLDESPKDKI
jgi:hypothetical protein